MTAPTVGAMDGAARPTDQAVPRATYRIQLRADFGFDDLAAVLPFLERLGVSHVYCSPFLKAAPGSSHGYDITDPALVNDELGGEDGLRRLLANLPEHDLGLVLDIVPNHLAITSGENRWWQDLLENGPASSFAGHFDVDWQPPEPRLRDRLLLPVLSKGYGPALRSGDLRMERRGGDFRVLVGGQSFPIALRSLALSLQDLGSELGGELTAIAQGLAQLGRPRMEQGVEELKRQRLELERWRNRLGVLLSGDAAVAAAVDSLMARISADSDALDRVLEQQSYRLSHWRCADRDLGYRRFFDINTLVGVRVEEEEVFRDQHSWLLEFLSANKVDGLRVDHPDGLRDPGAYLERLRAAAPGSWVVVEKILEPGEGLDASWPVAGTTGYDFARLATGIFIDPAGEVPLTRTYQHFTGEIRDFAAISMEGRREAVRLLLGSDLNRLTARLVGIVERHPNHRNHTRHELREALAELAASMPVYRTYLRAGRGSAGSAPAALVEAVETAILSRPDLDRGLLQFVGQVLSLAVAGDQEVELALRFQQLTAAVMGKGVEDTAFYRYHRLISLNEVGDDPGHFGISAELFHAEMGQRLKSWPNAMNGTSTHDSKRSEDVRCRINVLSEIPAVWATAVERWGRINRRHRSSPDLPDPEFEYFLYQMLVGCWPIPAKRLWPVLEKSAREAKRRTSWRAPNREYEEGLKHFVAGILGDPAFTAELGTLVAAVVPVAQVASLGVSLLKLTAPGVPDLYQGTELWDNSLVDPDNRRPVDYRLRASLLDEYSTASPQRVMADSEHGTPKLWLLARALRLRRERQAALGPDGAYSPLPTGGPGSERVLAFCRGEEVVSVVPRLPHGWAKGSDDPTVRLPPGEWRNQFTEAVVEGGEVEVSRLLGGFPVALLARQGSR